MQLLTATLASAVSDIVGSYIYSYTSVDRVTVTVAITQTLTIRKSDRYSYNSVTNANFAG